MDIVTYLDTLEMKGKANYEKKKTQDCAMLDACHGILMGKRSKGQFTDRH